MLYPALHLSHEFSRAALRAEPKLFELPAPHLVQATPLDGVARVLRQIDRRTLPSAAKSAPSKLNSQALLPQRKSLLRPVSIPLPPRKPVEVVLRNPEWTLKPAPKPRLHQTAAAAPKSIAVAAMRLQLDLANMESALQPSTSAQYGRPRGEVTQAIYDEASGLREGLVYGRHLVQAVPETFQRNVDRVIEPAETLWQGGPAAQQLIQDVKYEAHQLWNDWLNEGGAQTRAALNKEAERIDALKQENKLEEAAALELDHHLKTGLLAAPVVGLLWGTGAAVLAGGATIYRSGLLLQKGTTKLEKIKKVVSSKFNRSDFSKTLTAGAVATTIGSVGAAAFEGKPLHVYYNNNEKRGISAQFGAPAGVHEIALTFGSLSTSVWWGKNVTVGSGVPEWRRTATKRKNSKNNHGVSEQHQSMFVIGAGAHIGGDYNAAWFNKMAQLGNTTLTARNDPSKGNSRHSATQADVSWLYWSGTSGIAAGPLMLGKRATTKGKHFQGTASENRSGIGKVESKDSNYGAVRVNPAALHTKELEGLKPIFTIHPGSWWSGK